MEPVTIHRQADLDADADAAWELVADPDHLAGWLGDAVEIDLREGGLGVVSDDGIDRHLRVDRIVAGREMAFTWWHAEDPDHPSQVVLALQPLAGGRTRIDISETLAPRAMLADAVAADRARLRWEVRVLSLWACTVAAALVQ